MLNSNTDAFDLILLGTLDPYKLYLQCEKTGPNKIAEKYIATINCWAYHYAEIVLKGRFVLGEKEIATHGGWSYRYALNVLDGRFELGEEEIAASPDYSFLYAIKVLNNRFELGEAAIKERVTLWEPYQKFLKKLDKKR